MAGKIVGLFLILSAMQLGLTEAVYADGKTDGSEWAASSAQGGRQEASNATFDPRLPPVLPGEEVKDGRGTSKIWSTSGPVPVGTIAEPYWQGGDGGGQLPPGLGVIVDQRREK